MHYGARMKEWITDHDIRQRVLAKEFNVTESMLSHYMTGRNEITVDVLVKFARRCGISVDYLVGLTDDPNPPYPVSTAERGMLERFRSLSKEQRELIHQSIELMVQQNQR